MGNGDRTDLERGATLIAVGVTAAAALIAYFVFLGKAESRFEQTHDMGTCVQHFLWNEYQVRCQASFSDLTWPNYLATVVAPTVIYIFAHPLIGRLCVEAWNFVGTQLSGALELEDSYFEISRPTDVVAGSLWPIFILLLPLQLIALLITSVYRSVWY